MTSHHPQGPPDNALGASGYPGHRDPVPPPQEGGRIRSGLRKLFGRRRKQERSSEQEWFWVEEENQAPVPPPAWKLPRSTEESIRRAEEHGFLTSPQEYSPKPVSPQVEPSVLQVPDQPGVVSAPPPLGPPESQSSTPESVITAAGAQTEPARPIEADLPQWVFDSDQSSAWSSPEPSRPEPAAVSLSTEAVKTGPLPGDSLPSKSEDASYTILERNTQPIRGILSDLEVGASREAVESPAGQPPPAQDDYRYAREPDRDTLEAVYLPGAPPEPLPGTAEAFSSVEQLAPPEPPPPPPIAVAKSTGSYSKVEAGPAAGSARGAGEEGTGGRIGQKRHGPPAFAAEPDVRHVVLGFRDGTAVFLEPDHPLFSLFFQWSELVAGPETPPKAYARRQAQKKFYLGKAPRGKPKKAKT